MVSERMLGLGTARSVIRELFEYGKLRAAEVGAENVFDFSLGNPSVPAPDAVNEAAIRILKENPDLIHCYTSAQGDLGARSRFADSLNRRYHTNYTADDFYNTLGFGGISLQRFIPKIKEVNKHERKNHRHCQASDHG